MNKEEFIIAVRKLEIELTEEQLNKLDSFYHKLIEWNERINLTRITEEQDVYLKHFYDSLTIAKVVDLSTKATLCDVGTGAGFPGIVLKILFPTLKITLIDSLQKRINFAKQTIPIYCIIAIVTSLFIMIFVNIFLGIFVSLLLTAIGIFYYYIFSKIFKH